MPERIQLSRKKGWRIPPNTIKVDRSTKWGNPFIVGKFGTVKECIDAFEFLLSGILCVSVDQETLKSQKQFIENYKRNSSKLKDKNLACWCKSGNPCHADILIKKINK